MHTCHQSNAAIAYVYFDYKNREAQTADYVVRTILKQLLVQLDVIPRDLEAVYDDCCSQFKQPEKSLYIRQLLSVKARFSSVYILLDALDECTDATLENIVNLVCQLKDSGVRVFSTFRPNLIGLGDQLNVSVMHSIYAHNEDIRNYVSIQLDEKWCHNKCFKPQIINQLAKGAEGKSVSISLVC